MELTIFSRSIKNDKGREFKVYSTKLTDRETGETIYHTVKFREECGTPDKCPCNIEVRKEDCNIVTSAYARADGTEGIDRILWVKAWKDGSEYVDHSTDRYF